MICIERKYNLPSRKTLQNVFLWSNAAILNTLFVPVQANLCYGRTWQANMSYTTTLIRSAILIYGPYVSFSSPYRTVTRHKEGAVGERKRRHTYVFLVLKECDSGKCFTNSTTHFLTNRYGPQF